MSAIALMRKKEEFLKYLDGFKGYSALTIASYDESINEMLQWAEIDLDAKEINLMPLRLRIALQSPKTISRKLSAIRSFMKYLQQHDETIELKGDESVKVPKTLPKPIGHEHILHALKHADPTAALAITLLYTLGLRISELTHLRVDNISARWCRVVGKGAKERDLPLLEPVYTMIGHYHQRYPVQEFVFEEKGKKLSENSLRYTITKAFKEVGLKVTPHQLRHAYATELLNNQARIADVSELLGHESMATTQIYTKLGNALKMDHYLKSHPLCARDTTC
ncbi:MAG: tyrosine-type recombinase/integrase [Sulfuricurvum sp.]|jgi:integrase/recombinase XerC|uniref:tyrosine-type recombinase/integrase n=1 Tax=Sulfuricurvum sp. TaxID=2025608 RepID=UPI0025D6F9DD|nr:tyrosine-type recombinase/integrase [Sulfuricurvum sp.]MCK9371744.1 tyrosine-type recombinase/integrase [Sulfuricurvum sp.]